MRQVKGTKNLEKHWELQSKFEKLRHDNIMKELTLMAKNKITNYVRDLNLTKKVEQSKTDKNRMKFEIDGLVLFVNGEEIGSFENKDTLLARVKIFWKARHP